MPFRICSCIVEGQIKMYLTNERKNPRTQDTAIPPDPVVNYFNPTPGPPCPQEISAHILYVPPLCLLGFSANKPRKLRRSVIPMSALPTVPFQGCPRFSNFPTPILLGSCKVYFLRRYLSAYQDRSNVYIQRHYSCFFSEYHPLKTYP